MKIGILTYHRVVNDGSLMQTYCLHQLLQALLPKASVEIVDYRPMLLEKRVYRTLVSRRPPFFVARQWKKLKSSRLFLKKHCIISKYHCCSDELYKSQKFVNELEYDAIVVGSDTVWEVRENGGSPIAPNIYFLPGVDEIKKIAFAVWFDQTKRELLSKTRRSMLTSMIQDFDFVSVRDELSKKYLEEFGFKDSEITFMPDPTLLFDFSKMVEPAEELVDSKPLAGVGVAEPLVRQQVTDSLIEMGYHPLNLLSSPVKGQIQIPIHYSVEKRLGIYPLLDVMVTDRFHGSIFTLVLGDAPVLFLENEHKYPDRLSKGRDLFRRIGLEWAVCRHSGNKIPQGILKKTTALWECKKPNIRNQLAKLRISVKPLIESIRRTIG